MGCSISCFSLPRRGSGQRLSSVPASSRGPSGCWKTRLPRLRLRAGDRFRLRARASKNRRVKSATRREELLRRGPPLHPEPAQGPLRCHEPNQTRSQPDTNFLAHGALVHVRKQKRESARPTRSRAIPATPAAPRRSSEQEALHRDQRHVSNPELFRAEEQLDIEQLEGGFPGRLRVPHAAFC